MGRHANQFPHQFERCYDGICFEGVSFFPTNVRAKDVAADVRKYFQVPCRTLIVRQTKRLPERHLVMLPTCGLSQVVLDRMNDAAKWIRESESAEETDGTE